MQKKSWLLCKVLVWFVGLFVVGVIGLRWYFTYPVDEAAVQAVLSQVKKQLPALPPGAENRLVGVLVGVHEAQEEFEGPIDLWGFKKVWREWQDFLTGRVAVPDAGSMPKFRNLVAVTQGMIQATEKALKRPQSAVPLDFAAGEFFGNDSFDATALVDVHRLLLLACDLEAQAGEIPRALEMLEADLILIGDMYRPTGWTGRIWAEMMVREVVRFLPRFFTLATAHGDDSTLAADLDAALHHIRDDRGTIQDVMRFEMFFFEVVAHQLKDEMSYPGQRKEVPLWQKTFLQDITGPLILNHYIEYERNIIQAFYLAVLEVLNGDKPAVTFNRVQKILVATPRPWFHFLFEIKRLYLFHKTYREYLETTAFFNAAPALVALERYRLAKGSYPATLADLVTAGLLKAVPRDPFSPAQELNYRVQAEGYVLKSVGKYFKDNYDDVILHGLVDEEDEE